MFRSSFRISELQIDNISFSPTRLFKKELLSLHQTRISRGKPLLASTDSTDASY